MGTIGYLEPNELQALNDIKQSAVNSVDKYTL